jgi:hypothetical protein
MLKEIRASRGSKFQFTFGDYVTKIMCGTYDRALDDIEQRPGCCTIA